MKNIKTGVDKLIELVASKKKVGLEDAAKQLGVGSNVVQEWAETLEQSGLITIEYTLSKVFLVEKKITKDDILSTAKEAVSEKDALLRKIDVALTSLKTDTVGFDEIKRQFTDVQSHIKKEVETVRTELDQLEKYEQLKKGLDKEIEGQKKQFDDIIKKYTGDIRAEEERYKKVLDEITAEKKTIEGYTQKVGALRALKDETEKVIKTSKESLQKIEKEFAEQTSKVFTSEKKITELLSRAEQIGAEIQAKKTKNINDALNAITSSSNKVVSAQQDLLKKAEQHTAKINSYADAGEKIYDSFKGFFAKTIESEKLMHGIDQERANLEKDLESLKIKLHKLTISKGSNFKEELKDIEHGVQNVEKRKTTLRGSIEKLIDLIKGTKLK